MGGSRKVVIGRVRGRMCDLNLPLPYVLLTKALCLQELCTAIWYVRWTPEPVVSRKIELLPACCLLLVCELCPLHKDLLLPEASCIPLT